MIRVDVHAALNSRASEAVEVERAAGVPERIATRNLKQVVDREAHRRNFGIVENCG